MSKRMLIDGAHPEEIRVVVTSGKRLDEYDIETTFKKQVKGNIYLAKVTRVEPSLQAAFIDFGGNRHGFLAFSEIHPDYYQIPIEDRQALIQEQEALELKARAAREHLEDIGGDLGDGDDHKLDANTNNEHLEEGSEEKITRKKSTSPNAETKPEEASANTPDGDENEEVENDNDTPGENNVFDLSSGDEADKREGEEADPNPVAADPDVEEALEVAENASPRRTRGMRRYKIQEVIKRRQILLVQVVKEERGNKGAALTTYISLAGRYCVLMPNSSRGGGISRKITGSKERRKLRETLNALDIPQGMGVIIRTAGLERSKAEIKRDFEYLIRAWDEVREKTLQSTAPEIVYEEGDIIKRAIRDVYSKDIDEIQVDGLETYQNAKRFMRLMMPSHAKRVQQYRDDTIPLFQRFQIEQQLDAMHNAEVALKSGGYIVINPTEALVAIDVNSGKSTRERNIEETALKTNIEAAEEVARQLRLRDLAGLIVIDFIDMEDNRNVRKVERRLKDAMKSDRARLQIGRISNFGLLEMSRQRLRPSLLETSSQICPHCRGTGNILSTESMAMRVLRAIEEEGIRLRTSEIKVKVPSAVALYILNQKRATLVILEQRYGFQVTLEGDNTVIPPDIEIERAKGKAAPSSPSGPPPQPVARNEGDSGLVGAEINTTRDEENKPKRRRRRGRRQTPKDDQHSDNEVVDMSVDNDKKEPEKELTAQEQSEETNAETNGQRRRRRGRRGGRRRNRETAEEKSETLVQEKGVTENEPKPASNPASTDVGRVNVDTESSPGNSPLPYQDISPRVEERETAPTADSNNNAVDKKNPDGPANTLDETIVQSVADIADISDDRPKRRGWWQK
ncbi:MAG: ribonuclease E/G [Pseudomonadota bacterium]|nr:ribonuclease E/G [Pseudomonadota bacterium]